MKQTTGGPVLPRVFLAEDDVDLRGVLARILTVEGYSVCELAEGLELPEALARSDWKRGRLPRPEVVLTDPRAPGMDGLAAVQRARAAGMDCPVIVMTGPINEAIRRAVRRLSATHLLPKPTDLEQLLGLVRSVTCH